MNVNYSINDWVFNSLMVASSLLFLFVLWAVILGSAPVGWLTSLRTYLLPWLAALAVLSIGRELWMIRVYAQHSHLSEIMRWK